MTIKQKLIIAFSTILIILAGVGILSIQSLEQVNNKSTEIVEETIPQLNLVHTLNFEIARYRSFEFQHIILTDTKDMDDLEVRMQDLENSIGTNIKEYQSKFDNDVIKDISGNWEAYVAEHAKLIETSRALKSEESLAIIKGTSKEKYDAIADAMLNLVDASKAEAENASKEGDVTYKNTKEIITIVIMIALLLGIIMAIINIISVTKPIGQLRKRLQELAYKNSRSRVAI